MGSNEACVYGNHVLILEVDFWCGVCLYWKQLMLHVHTPLWSGIGCDTKLSNLCASHFTKIINVLSPLFFFVDSRAFWNFHSCDQCCKIVSIAASCLVLLRIFVFCFWLVQY